MSAAKSSGRSPARTADVAGARLGALDAAIIAAFALFAALLMVHGGSRRGVELMPWPDGLEYAAMAANIAHGAGPVLHFGGYSYPARYTEGYPLILAAAERLGAVDVPSLYLVTIAMGLLALALIYFLTLSLFGRAGAVIATLMLALSPVFLTNSALVLSDVPTLAVTIYAACALLRATEAERAAPSRRSMILDWAIFGIAAGFTVMIRPTNATIVAGVVLALAMVPPGGAGIRLTQVGAALGAFAIALAIPPLWQLHEDSLHLGGPAASGYAWWVPEVYGSMGRVFNAAFLFGPTMPRNPHGNLIVYATTLLGLDGMLGDRGDARFLLYPFVAAAFAAIGIVAVLREPGRRVEKRVVWFGLGYLAALVAVYAVYFFTDVAFILPATFVLFAGAGYGAVVSNRWMRDVVTTRRRSPRHAAGAACVIVLDVMLAVALAEEAGARMGVQTAESAMVPALLGADAQMPSDAVIVSNVSLQFLELYAPGAGRRFIGLNSLDPGERFTDYHLHRLYAKGDSGWSGPIPPVLFDRDQISKQVAGSIAEDARKEHGAYLLLAAPESREYAALLKDEMDRVEAAFALEPLLQTPSLALYRMTPR